MPTPYDKLVDKLADIEISGSMTDASYLNDVRSMLTLLLQSGRDDQEIRTELRRQSAQGQLQTEMVDLVSTLLDGMSSEDIPTTPHAANVDDAGFNLVFGEGEDYAATAVIESVDDVKKERDQELQIGSVLRDRFMLVEKVAGGSMGVVFKALDRRMAEAGETTTHVAIKVLSPKLSNDPKALRALQQEAAKGRFLSHPNIVRFIDLDRDDDMYFIVMEWLEGENLANVLDNTDRMDAAQAIRIVKQIGSALEYAHNRGIVHADVKPANVMILPDGNATLFDFGVARIRQQQDVTSSGFNPRIMGAHTPAYSSMQVLTGDEPVPQDDVFSLACLFYRLIAGHRVFGPRNAAEAAEEGMTPQELPELTAPQWKAVKKALSFSRVTRYADIREFMQALSPTVDTPTIAADRTSRLVVEQELETRSKLPWYFALLLLIGGLSAYLIGAFDPWLRTAPSAIIDNVEPAVTRPDESSAQTVAASIETPDIETTSSAAELDAAAITDPDQPAQLAADEENQTESAPSEPDVVELEEPVLIAGDVQVLLDGTEQSLVLRENGAAVAVDFVVPVRSDQERIFAVRELRFTGNRSPLQRREVTMELQSELRMPPGADRAQIVFEMTPDPVREADQQLVLELYETRAPTVSLGTLRITLEDDDQRQFESQLPTDTVAFAAGQASVSESDAVVQVDIVRFKPSGSALRVNFSVTDVTASSQSDYFPPESNVIEFAAGERNARLLIPLVQDAEVEGNEAFVVELLDANSLVDADLYQRTVVMIRDDD